MQLFLQLFLQLHSGFDNSLKKFDFFIFFKLAAITPVFKKEFETKGYLWTSRYITKYIKVFERSIFQQIYSFKADLDKDTTKCYLLVMMEKWKSVIDKGSSFGAPLTD